jgi:uncharacterized membrane protein YkoI
VNLTFPARPVVVGLALAGAVGVGATVAAAAQGPSGDPAVTPVAASVDTSAATTRMSGMTMTSHAAVQRPLAASTPVSISQAATIAARQAGGRVTKVDSEAEGAALTYEVTLLRANGVETKVTVDARTGHLLSTATEQSGATDQSEGTEQPEVKEQPDARDGSDGTDPSEAKDQPDTTDHTGATR